jgi:hypothetical protein
MGTSGDETTRDEALVFGMDPERKETFVLRRRGEDVEAGVVRPLQEGRPIHGDVVRLKPRPEFPLLCDVETLVKHPDPPVAPRRAGPAMVSNDAYRRGWEQVFGTRLPPCDEPN